MKSGTLSCSTNCFAVWAVTSILYWLSWTMKSIWAPLTPPAALICLTASFAPFAAGRSSADSSPVRANPPPILIVPLSPDPPAAGLPPAATLAPAVLGATDAGAADAPPAVDAPGVAVVHAAARTIALRSAMALRVMTPPQNQLGAPSGALTARLQAYDDRVRAGTGGRETIPHVLAHDKSASRDRFTSRTGPHSEETEHRDRNDADPGRCHGPARPKATPMTTPRIVVTLAAA